MSKLNSKEIKRIVKEINYKKKRTKKNLVDFETEMKEAHSHFAEHYPEIFKAVIAGTLDMNMFKYMLSMLRQMENGAINERNASIAVGQVLVDKYVKPLIDEDGDKKN